MEASELQRSIEKELMEQKMQFLNKAPDPTRSEKIDLLVTALALAQGEIKAPDRNRTVKVTPRSGGQGYSFRYATLDHIIDIIRGPLTKNGLWFTQIMKEDNGTFILDTRLLHNSGQWMACQTPLIVEGGSNQQFGSALTFMRRYSLTSLLGIAAEEDDDASVADGNTVDQVQDRKPVPAKPDVMKPDPISSGLKIKTRADKSGGDGDGVALVSIAHPATLEIGMNADQSGSDWVGFGRELVAEIKASGSVEVANLWRDLNKAALEQMEKDAPKMFSNLSVSIIKAIKDLEKGETNAG